MDAVTLALAKAYTNSQRNGYVEPGTKITFDGDTSGKTMIPTPDGRTYVHVSEEIPDLSNVESMVLWDGTQTVTITKDEFFYTAESGMPGLFHKPDGYSFVMAFPMDMPMGDVTMPKGVYAMVYGASYISSINFPETIHPIDPKFLPGATAIDLTQYIGELQNGSGTVANFNNAVLELFSKGGGTLAIADNTDYSGANVSVFWADVSTDRQLKFVINASALANGLTVEANANSRTVVGGMTSSIEFSFLVFLDGCVRATVVFTNNFDGTAQIAVAVEQVAIPGA